MRDTRGWQHLKTSAWPPSPLTGPTQIGPRWTVIIGLEMRCDRNAIDGKNSRRSPGLYLVAYVLVFKVADVFFNQRRKFKLGRVIFCDLAITPWVWRNVMGLSRIKPLYILVIRYIQSGLNEIPEKTPNKKKCQT